MDEADVTVEIDLTTLSPGQARAVVQQIGLDQPTASKLGRLLRGEDVREDVGSIEVHLTAEEGLNALTWLGVLETPGDTAIEGDNGDDGE